MVNITTKYLILFWIIALILFTFYCIFRIKHNKEKYYDISSLSSLSSLTPKITYPNVYSYINNVEKINKITDIPGCQNVYDDNIAVRTLGYSSCNNAYIDYLAKNLDVNNKFGQIKSLADICPVSCKTPKYNKCSKDLLDKYTSNANMLDNITSTMTDSINSRIKYRSSALNEIQNSMNSIMYNKDQNGFNKTMLANGSVAIYPADTPGLINNFYNNKYGASIPESNISRIESFISSLSTYIVDPLLESIFFGSFVPIAGGQFIIFNDLIIKLGYDDSGILNINNTNIIQSNSQSQSQQQQQTNTNKLILTLTSKSNNLEIVYTINTLSNYNGLQNAIKLVITDKYIVSQPTDSQVAQNLFTILGFTVPTQLVMTFEEFVSTENIKHSTYKLANENLDTILVLHKQN